MLGVNLRGMHWEALNVLTFNLTFFNFILLRKERKKACATGGYIIFWP